MGAVGHGKNNESIRDDGEDFGGPSKARAKAEVRRKANLQKKEAFD